MDMNEMSKRLERLRALSNAKLQYLRERAQMIEQAFDELEAVQDEELDVVYAKIDELDRRLSNLE